MSLHMNLLKRKKKISKGGVELGGGKGRSQIESRLGITLRGRTKRYASDPGGKIPCWVSCLG